jgi:hypothetical protein
MHLVEKRCGYVMMPESCVTHSIENNRTFHNINNYEIIHKIHGKFKM